MAPLARLKALQDCLGDLNDLVVLRSLCSSLDLNPEGGPAVPELRAQVGLAA